VFRRERVLAAGGNVAVALSHTASARLDGRGGVCAFYPPDQLRFGSQKLGDPPTLVVALGFGDRLVDRLQSDMSRRGQPCASVPSMTG
jgi:hypothetical protein